MHIEFIQNCLQMNQRIFVLHHLWVRIKDPVYFTQIRQSRFLGKVQFIEFFFPTVDGDVGSTISNKDFDKNPRQITRSPFFFFCGHYEVIVN